jgi:hypothetical protein
MRRIGFALIPALLALGCFGAPRAGGPGDPNMLLEDEISASTARSAYELIEQLRPRWLRERTSRSLRLDTVILVYRDGARFGPVESLHDIPLQSIRTIRVLDAAEAGQLPGLGSQHVERVIMVSSTRPR